MHHPDRPLRFTTGYFPLSAVSQIPAQRHPDGPSHPVLNRAGITKYILSRVRDDPHTVPRSSVIGAAADDEVDIAGIGPAVLPRLAEGEHGAVFCRDQRRDPIGVIPVLCQYSAGWFLPVW